MSVDMTPSDHLNDQVIYTILNKVKHSSEEPQDVSFIAEDLKTKRSVASYCSIS